MTTRSAGIGAKEAFELDRQSGPPIAFGPIRSRRLGWSLGINNVPPKTCTYACVYCQAGATDRARFKREAYVAPEAIVDAVAARLAECRAAGVAVDYATFVPNGEPTLDVRLGEAIRSVAGLGLRVAVITNGTLLWRDDVRAELADADWVSVKVDTVDEPTWRRLNRPIGNLRLETIMEGMCRFAAEYRGDLVTETMLIDGLNVDDESLLQTATFVSCLEPLRAYIAIPTRPPAEAWVRAPTIQVARHAVTIFRSVELPTELLVEEVEGGFAPSTDPTEGLLGIVAVHPMTTEDARDYLARSGGDPSTLQRLLEEGRLSAVTYGGRTYLRRAHRSNVNRQLMRKEREPRRGG